MEKRLIIFTNGLEIEVESNGDSYITDTEPNFPDDLSVVIIKNGDDTTELKNINVQECASIDGRYWFVFVPMSEIEIRFAEIEDALCELSIMED